MKKENILLTTEQFEALSRLTLEQNPDMASIINPSEFDENYITNPELMGMLKVSRRTIQRWRMTGRIPFVKIGSKVYYRKDTLLENFEVHPCGIISSGHAVAPDYDESKEEFQPMVCERCPLFLILNS
jgi:excisionase family DNA binding protein